MILAGGPWGLPLEVPLLPDLLAPLGYTSRMVGKWHLGHHKIEFTPVNRIDSIIDSN